MSETKWTPGPWRFLECVGGGGWIEYVRPSGLTGPITEFTAPVGTKTEICANAHLIAAAPILYEALQDARDFIAETMAKIGDGHKIAELVVDFDYALAKARGE